MKYSETYLQTGLLLICLSSSGCGPGTSVQHLGNGYDEVTYTRHNLSEPESHQITLQYLKPNGEYVMVWPSIYGHVMNDHILIFIGDRASGRRDPDGRLILESRLFAVNTHDPALDITDEVIFQWSSHSGQDFIKNQQTASIASLEQKDNRVILQFAQSATNDLNISMTWDEILTVADDVRQHGVLHEDPKWKVHYLQK